MCWIEPALGYFSAISGLMGSGMLAVPYVLRQRDRDAVESLQASRPARQAVARAYDLMSRALKDRIIRASLSDFRCGIWGCVGLAVSFILLLAQLTVRLTICTA